MVRQWPLGLVLVGLGVSLIVVTVEDFRPGATGFGGTVLFAAFLRLVLPERMVGLLALRGRGWDVLTLFLLGLGTLVLALVVPEIRR